MTPRARWWRAVAVGAFAAIELGYAVWAAFVASSRVGPRVGFGPDSIVYLTAARAPVWDHRFLAGPGPFGFLLLAKVCARNLRAIVVVQTAISAASWALLATTVASLARSLAARWVALLAILGVGLSPMVLQWNAFITTESLSISLLCAVLALALRVAVRGARRDLVWFVAALAAFAFTRDTNALAVGLVGVIGLGVAFARPAARRGGLVVGVAGLALALGASALANAADPPRWFWPVGETVAIRLLADPGARGYLVDHGFPLDDRTRTLPQQYVYLVDRVVHGREYAPFRTWLRSDGRRAYVDYLVTHPGWTLRKPFDDRRRLLVPGVDVYGIVYDVQPRGPFGVLGGLTTPPGTFLIELWTLGAVIALAWCARRDRGRMVAAVTGAALLLSIVGFYASWHGDVLEADRHALTSAVQLRLALWIATALLTDALVTRGRASGVRVPGETDLDREEGHRAPSEEVGADRRELTPGGGSAPGG